MGSLRLERSFADGGLVSLAPQLSYTASLLDKTGGTEAKAIEETIEGSAPFGSKEAAVSLIANHRYAIGIDAETTTSTAGIGLLGTIAAAFDNVSLTGPGANPGGPGGESGGGGGRNGRNGASGLTSSELRSIVQSSLSGPAVLVHGRRILARAACPARVGRACAVTLTGLLTRRQVATARRVGRVAIGRKRPLLLRVKPRARARVARSGTLLFKETVQAGKTVATVYRRLKLIKRG